MPSRAPGQWRAIATPPAVAATFLTAVVLGACSPLATTIAEESGVDGGPDGSAESRGPRGRVEVSADRELVTDRGTRLHGVTIGSDVGLDFSIETEPELARPLIRRFFDRMALEAGLNAMHVYLENEEQPLGSGLGFANLLVDETERAGLYLVLGFGSGSMLGSFDEPLTRAFWDFYAPLYANRTHVLYELHNGPERSCDVPFNTATIGFELRTYDLIRGHAPSTHVILMSYVSTPTDMTLADGVSKLSAGGVDFGNESIGFHAMPCPITSDITTLVIPEPPVAMLATELPPDAGDWPEATPLLESRKIGWMSFHWLRFNSNLDDFVSKHTGITWCPDFGTWPDDSSTCVD